MKWLKSLSTRMTKTAEPVVDQEDRKLLDAIDDLKREYRVLESFFNSTDDGDMIDYYAHQLKALNARYAYLIKQARGRNLTHQPQIYETALR